MGRGVARAARAWHAISRGSLFPHTEYLRAAFRLGAITVPVVRAVLEVGLAEPVVAARAAPRLALGPLAVLLVLVAIPVGLASAVALALARRLVLRNARRRFFVAADMSSSSFYFAGFCGRLRAGSPQAIARKEGCARHIPDRATNVGRRPPTKRQPATGLGRGKTKYHILSKNSAMCPPSRTVVPLPPFHLDVARRRAPRDRQTFLQGRLPSRDT